MAEKNNKDNFTSVIEYKNVHDIIAKNSDTEKYLEYREAWKNSYSFGKTPAFPIQIDFELNYSCNFKCPMCTWNIENTKGSGKETWFDFDVYKQVIDTGVKKGLRAIRLNYINEPLIRSDVVKYIEYAKSAGILDIYFSTNGSLLNEKISRKLIESGLTRIQVSLDAATEETYKKIRLSNYSLQEVTDNVLRFIKIRDEEYKKELPIMRVNFVKTNNNSSELNNFVNFWQSTGIEAIGIQNLINVIDSIKSPEKKDSKAAFKCTQPFNHLVIRYNGNILPCCSFFGAETPIAQLKANNNVNFSQKKNLAQEYSPLAEARDNSKLLIQSIEEAWNSDKINYLRKIHSDGEYWKHPVCKRCVLSTSHLDETQG